jgi:hypothetical protein
MGSQGALATLLQPTRVWSRGEVLQRPCPVPAGPGIYGWYFKELPHPINTRSCVVLGDLTLLYVGISPKAPPRDGRAGSQQTLRSRIRDQTTTTAMPRAQRFVLLWVVCSATGSGSSFAGSGVELGWHSPGESIVCLRGWRTTPS